jgi:hypothetical protein
MAAEERVPAEDGKERGEPEPVERSAVGIRATH